MSKLKSHRRIKQKNQVEASRVARSSGSSFGAQVQLLTLQQMIGNQGVNRLLRLSSPKEVHEQEADRMARSITQSSSQVDSDVPVKQLGRSPVGTGNLLGPGKPLPSGVRSELEPRFGYDLSSVRIHENETAAESARSINASAYTVGTNVVFGQNQFSPQTSAGRNLLAHELTHVIQQQSSATGSISPGLVQRKEDWDFTRKDYEDLIAKKGKLKISSDSKWFPAKFQENLLNTLNYLFDPTAKPPGTEGVNVRDLYHGHVGLDVNHHLIVPSKVDDKKVAFEEKQKKLQNEALGYANKDLTSADVGAFTKAEEASLPPASALLKAVLKQKGVVVIYHTFENSQPSDLEGGSLIPGSSRRNYLTPLDTNKPVPYSPPDLKKAASWHKEYWPIFQFSFLVDENGEVHVRTVSTKNLSSVTGTPLK